MFQIYLHLTLMCIKLLSILKLNFLYFQEVAKLPLFMPFWGLFCVFSLGFDSWVSILFSIESQLGFKMQIAAKLYTNVSNASFLGLICFQASVFLPLTNLVILFSAVSCLKYSSSRSEQKCRVVVSGSVDNLAKIASFALSEPTPQRTALFFLRMQVYLLLAYLLLINP